MALPSAFNCPTSLLALVTWSAVGPPDDALISICIFKSSWFSSDIWDLVPSLEDTFVFAGCWAAVCDCLVLPPQA
ncbi:hypothetical protein [Streptomyces mirabilis]|uniref:hypothetical protein n=1 Tax=Streptomyces mirabilis TaxID=68239 RepID=UPI00364C237B